MESEVVLTGGLQVRSGEFRLPKGVIASFGIHEKLPGSDAINRIVGQPPPGRTGDFVDALQEMQGVKAMLQPVRRKVPSIGRIYMQEEGVLDVGPGAARLKVS